MASPARGWKITPQGKEPLSERNKQIISQIDEGKLFSAIAKEFGISVQRVSAIRRQAGRKRRVDPA